MEKSKIIEYFKTLDTKSQKDLLSKLQVINDESSYDLLTYREKQLNNKEGSCPHCGLLKYFKNGKSKGVQNYKCKSCNRSFTAYTGTWLAHIHKKELLVPYLKLMHEDKSLDNVVLLLNINKKTAFDWRHKITSSLSYIEDEKFKGITESDETFFLHSKKGDKKLTRDARKRGKDIDKRGISKEHVAVIVSTDRVKTMDLKVSCLGRLSKKDIDKAIGEMISDRTVLCSDGHRSYKAFANEKQLEQHIIKANKKEYVKEKKYHIQNVNSIHSRLKKWLNDRLLGVSTKYLQNYMNWSHIKEKYKTSEFIRKLIDLTATNIYAKNEYRSIDEKYLQLVNIS